jgi:integrase
LRGKIRLKHYSLRTEQAYIDWIKRFIRFHGKRHPGALGAAEVEAFLTDLAVTRRVAGATQNQAKSALLFLYKEVLDIELPWLERVERARTPQRLPVVLTPDEVARVLDRLHGVHALIGRLLYGTCMRVMEGMRLRVKDVDFERREILVRDGKGLKDRVTVLPRAVVPQLRGQLGQARALYEKDVAAGFGAGAAGTQRREHHHDLHPRTQPRRPRRDQPARPALKRQRRVATSSTTPAAMTAMLAQPGITAVSFSAMEKWNGPNCPSCVSLVYSKWP